jgi:hypothetical protein
MTPKEKAYQLVNEIGLNASLILIKEVLISNPTIINCDNIEFNYGYWQQVKNEIKTYESNFRI